MAPLPKLLIILCDLLQIKFKVLNQVIKTLPLHNKASPIKVNNMKLVSR